MIVSWLPYAIVRDPDIRRKIEKPDRFMTTERPYGLGQHAQHEPKYPNLTVSRMLDIERAMRRRMESNDAV